METISIEKSGGLFWLHIEAFAHTKDWDRVEKSRSFQNGAMTYAQVAKELLSTYHGADIKDQVTNGEKIPEFLLQYEETDWGFLRRLASHFGSYLFPDATDASGKVYFGLPHIQYGTQLEKHNYILEKDLLYHARVLEKEGILSQEVSCWKVRVEHFLHMWETVTLNGVEVVVTGMKLYTHKGELVYSYDLSRSAGIRREKEKNPRIFGMSIPATVMERSGNRIRVHFDIDPSYEAGEQTKYFTYAIESSSFYCMPEEGSQVHIYFPNHDEQSAIAVHAIRTEPTSAGACSNPNNKRFSSPSGSAMDMTPETLQFAPDSSGATVLHMKSSGFLSLTGMNITIKTQMGMMSNKNTPAKQLMICGEQKLTMQIGDAGEDSIVMETATDIKSAFVIQQASAFPPAVPSGDELLSEMEAADQEYRDAENKAVEDDMVTKKVESKQKVANGLLSLVTAVGVAALTIATGGLTLAAVAAVGIAGIEGVFSIADIADGLDGYSKMNALDASRPANFLRDTVFGGNQAAYDIASMISDIAFSIVSANAISDMLSGAEKVSKISSAVKKVGDFWSKICSKTKWANFAFQMGGTVLFGAFNDYMVTGRVDIGNMCLDTLAGLTKGTLGTYGTEKLKALLKIDNKWLEKLAGTAAGTAFGTIVDLGVNAISGREVDPLQILQQNLIESGLGQFFGEPIDVVTGAFLITATDFVLSDIRENILVQRKYNSTNKDIGLLGQGWRFTYEGRLYKWDDRLYAMLDSGITAMFQWDGAQAVNLTRGHQWLELTKQEDGWKIYDHKQHKSHCYNAQGLLVAVQDQNGQSLRLWYDEEKLTRITAPLGYYLDITIQNGRLTQMKDNIGRTMQYRYENGRLSHVVHMDEGVTRYFYDDQGYLIRAIDQANVTYLENEYDDTGKVVLQTLANGDTYQAEYHPESRQVSVVDSIYKATTHYKYNPWGEILSIGYEDGTQTLYEYDENGNRISETDRLSRKTSWQYDHMGRVIEETRCGGLQITSKYDEADNLVLQYNNAGIQTIYQYDQQHNCIFEKTGNETEQREKSFVYDWMGRVVETTDGAGNRTRYQYEEGLAEPSIIQFADGEECHFEYDKAGRMMAQEDQCGRVEYGYNARNKRALVRDGEGNESRWLYDGMGRLLAKYSPLAWKEQKGEYSYRYDFLDRLIDTKQPDGSHQRQMRDGEGNITKQVHPNSYNPDLDDGEGTSYEYDSNGNPIRIHHPDGGCERIFYDGEGNRIRHILPESYHKEKDDGEGWIYEYDEANRLTKIIGPDGTVQSYYQYDPMGNLVEETDAVGRTSYRKYTAFGEVRELLTPATEENGQMLYQRTTWQYDSVGNVVCECRHGGYWSKEGRLEKEEGADLKLQFYYDKRNRRIRVEDGLGAVNSFRYDVQGKLVYEEKRISEQVSQIVRYGYDRAGRLIEKKEELNSGLAPQGKEKKYAITRYCYDENGNQTEVITPEGYRIVRKYDLCDQIVEETTIDKANGIHRKVQVCYDLAGNITKVVRQGKGQAPWQVSYGYDLKDRITHVKDCMGPVFGYEYNKNDWLKEAILPQPEQEMAYKNRDTYQYDPYGRMLSREDGAGNLQEQRAYTKDGKLLHEKRADGNIVEYSYGANALEKELHTARSKQAKQPAQQYRYDSRGRIIGVINGNGVETGYRLDTWGRIGEVNNPDGGKEQYSYDYAGNITSTKDANGGVITYRYNSMGKVCEIIDQEGASETFRYDREGRMILHTDRNGNQVRTQYNVDGNPVREIAINSSGEQAVTRSWEYDTAGNVKKAICGGLCYSYRYRADGKLLKKSSGGKTLISCTYFADGSLESLTDVSGKTVYYGYDWRGKLSSVRDEEGKELASYTHTAGGKLKEIYHGNGTHTSYEYDTEDNIIRLRLEGKDGQTISDFQYCYDGNGNRTVKSGSRMEGEGLRQSIIHYSYDTMGRLLQEEKNGQKTVYVYDLCGNRLKKLDKKGKEEYTYNEKNQLVSWKSAGGYTTYQYDQQGNLLQATGTEGNTFYSYNAFNQQTAVVMANGDRLESRYDPEKLRAQTKENGKIINFLYHQGELIAELNDQGEAQGRYILGYGVAAGWRKGKEGYNPYHLDEQNSTMYITGEKGAIQNSYHYDAFGVVEERQQGIENRILYTGQQYDQITGQYYLRARYYNQALGRFLQEDVYRGDGLNLYAYCKNNPVTYYDPSGYDDKCTQQSDKANKKGQTVHENEIPWSSGVVSDAARQLQRGQSSVTVKSRSQAEELFLRLYQGKGYTNVTNMDAMSAKNLLSGKKNIYHWDDIFGSDGYLLKHGTDNPDAKMAHLQIHPEKGSVIRIFFGTQGGN